MNIFTQIQEWFNSGSLQKGLAMTKGREIQRLEDKVVETAEMLVLAVLADEVKRGVSGLATPMAKCMGAINNLRVARGQGQM